MHEWEVFDTSDDGVVVVERGGKISYVNPALVTLTGYAPDELIGQEVEILVAEERRAYHDRVHAEYRDNPSPRMMAGPRLELRRRDGELRTVAIALAPIDGGARTVATVRDLTERLALEAQRERLQQMLDLVPDAIAVCDADTLLIEYANPALAALVGVSVEELLGEPIRRVRPSVDDPTRRVEIDRLVAGAEVTWAEAYPLRHVSGAEIPVELNRRLIIDDLGGRHVVGVARDARPRIAQEARLRSNEEAFRTAFEQAPIGAAVVVVGEDGSRSIVLANHAMAELFGCPVPELIGHDLSRFRFPGGPAIADRLFTEVAAGDRRIVSGQVRYRREDGTTWWAEVRGAPCQLPDIPGLTFLMHWLDVTDRVVRLQRQERRAALQECVAEVATAALGGEREALVLKRIANGAARTVAADAAAVILTDDDSGGLRWAAITGEPLKSALRVDEPVHGSVSLGALDWTETLLLPGPPADATPGLAASVGPVAVARFGGADTGPSTGLVVTVRTPGGAPFTDEDADDLLQFATQTQLAVHLARARADQERLALLEDRQRIARDLHDHVLQDVIALGLGLAAGRDDDDPPDDRDEELLDGLERVVQQLRLVVFEVQLPAWEDLAAAVEGLVAEAQRVLGHRPEVVLEGPLESVPPGLARDLLAVLRESLANVARHARARHTRIVLQAAAAEDAVTLTVADDGVGLPATLASGYGISNMRQRAEARNGSCSLAVGGGWTRLTWSCPVSAGA